MSLLHEVRSFWRAEPRDHRVALVAIVLVGIILRLLTLSQPMRYDEAVTYLEFVRQPLSQALSGYDNPKNHLFHTLLAKASVAVFGNAPWAIRLPAFVAGVTLVPLTYGAARILYGARAAIVAAALVSASGVLTLYSTNARGYSLVVAAFLVLVLLAAQLIRAPGMHWWVAYGVVSALGVWTIPVMLYPLGAVSLWLALSLLVDGRRRELGWLGGALALGAALTLGAYGPVFARTGVASVVRNKFVASSVWTQFLGDMAVAGWDTIRSWGLGWPPIVHAGALAIAAVALARHERLSSFRVGVPLAAFVWSAWLLVVTHRAPFPRIWLWCIPVVSALVGAGLVDLLDRSRRMARFAARVPLLAGIVAVAGSASVAVSGAVLRTRDTGTFVDAEATALQLSTFLRPGDRVTAATPTDGPLAYYFDRLGVDPAYFRGEEAEARRLVVIVNEGEGETIHEVLQGLAALDTARYASSLIANRPRSKVYLFERRDAPK
ncbi:MAG: glycosyltransferase family 39 protein [Gemmatimonadota bacterium]